MVPQSEIKSKFHHISKEKIEYKHLVASYSKEKIDQIRKDPRN